MPRRNRPPARRRKGPLPAHWDDDPDSRSTEPAEPSFVAAPPPVGEIQHFDGCSNRGDLQTYLGRFGDLLTRCRACKALAVAPAV